MTKLVINPPVKTTTRGGLPATIFEIDTDESSDGLRGIIYTPGMGDIAKQWNDVGICRDAPDDCNLNPHDPLVADVIKKLRSARS